MAQHLFSQVPKAEIQRSRFDRSHNYKTTFDSGKLIPCYVDEALPGDTFNMKMSGFARLATPIHPIMDNLYMETFFFAVPMRLVWENWEKFNGAQDTPSASTDFTIPQQVAPGGGFSEGTQPDYMGVPVDVPGISISMLPFRAYNLIWNEWFRDENLQSSVTTPIDDATSTSVNLRSRGKRHDYFTSCLPWPAKDNGNPVTLPLGTSAPVIGIGNDSTMTWETGTLNPNESTGEAADPAYTTFKGIGDLNASGGQEIWINSDGDGYPAIYADLTDATASTINEIRQAFQIQRLQERDARGGTRYTEIIKAHFGVTSPDARLQRPEFLGGGGTMININPVQQTTPTGIVPDVTPQGNLAAYGTASWSGHGFTKSFTEHCIIIGMVSVRADLTYQSGINKMWLRKSRYDFYWPALSHIGEQVVENQEIYAQGTSEDTETFGYQERYAEYRYKPSLITGRFRSSYPESLDAWHLSQDFGSLPVLGDTFIQDTPPVDRIVAVPSEPQFLFDAYFNLNCARPMPLYGVPGFVDHF